MNLNRYSKQQIALNNTWIHLSNPYKYFIIRLGIQQHEQNYTT